MINLLRRKLIESKEQAWDRAQKRFLEIKRYVPKEYVDQTFDRLYPNLKKLIESLEKEKESYAMTLYDNSESKVISFCTLFFMSTAEMLIWKFIVQLLKYFFPGEHMLIFSDTIFGLVDGNVSIPLKKKSLDLFKNN